MSIEQFVKENDYTLSIIQKTEENDDGVTQKFRLTRTFNFAAAQITTITSSMVYESRGSSAGGSAATSAQTTIQNFSDIDSKEEIKLMHEKLKELGGNPPELSFELGKRPTPVGLTRPGA